MTIKQVLQTQKRERALMKRMGFVPHVDEDNNGKPAYQNIDNEEIDDESAMNGTDSASFDGGNASGGNE